MKRQIIVIHGGDAFETEADYQRFLRTFDLDLERYRAGKKEWKEDLYKELGKNYEVYLPSMPNRLNAKYAEWKLWFNKIIALIKPEAILVGHSLGALFLAKFLSEEEIDKKILATFLVAAPYSEGTFKTPKNFAQLERQGGKLFVYHSQDDKIVPFSDFLEYKKSLHEGIFREFKNRGHFIGSKIPELIKDIKSLQNI